MLSFCGHSEHSTQAIFFYELIFKIINLKTEKRHKTIWIRKFEHDIFLIPLNVTSSETRRENGPFKSKFDNKKSPRGPNNLFSLNDFSNYRGSNYMSSTVLERCKIY